MSKGIIFDIKEFALNDGPGIRVSVFFKGCPLKCLWCHNPEGLKQIPQYNFLTNKYIGNVIEAKALAKYLIKFEDIFEISGGGVTFSGGEPLMQGKFLLELIDFLPNINKCLDTSGMCDSNLFLKVISKIDLVFFDLKLIRNDLHVKYCNVSNKLILENLKNLARSSVNYRIRIPLIPTITDTIDNLESIGEIVKNLDSAPIQVDLLPYNELAGAKYPSYHMKYQLSDLKLNLLQYDNIRKFMNKYKNCINIVLH